MLSISYISAVLFGLLTLLVGWLMGKFLFSTKGENWKEKYSSLAGEQNALNKKVKNQDQQIVDLKHKSESWKHEFQVINKEMQGLRKDHALALDQLNANHKDLEEQLNKKNSSLTISERSNERFKKEIGQLKEKYKKDTEDSKGWKRDKSTMKSELESVQLKLSKTNAIAVDYKKKCESQEAEMAKINELTREIRGLRAKRKKLESDCAYWEKKHFDVHHELAKLKEEQEKWKVKFNNLEELRKGDEILKQNLVGQIQEFKSKFLSVSDKYRELSKN